MYDETGMGESLPDRCVPLNVKELAMRLIVSFCCLALIAFSSAAASAQDAFRDDFDHPGLDGWYAAWGEWTLRDGRLHQTAGNWGRHVIFRRMRLQEGTVRVHARVDKPDRTSGASFGIVLSYPGEKGPVFVRIGAYGGAGLMQPVKDESFQGFRPEIGRDYELVVQLHDGKVTASVDGKTLGTARLTESPPAGYLGLYTECMASFDDFEVSGRWKAEPLAERIRPAP